MNWNFLRTNVTCRYCAPCSDSRQRNQKKLNIKNPISLIRQQAANSQIYNEMCEDFVLTHANKFFLSLELLDILHNFGKRESLRSWYNIRFFFRKTTSKTQRRRNVNFWLEIQSRNDNVVTTLVFCWSYHTENTMLW